MIRVAHIMLTYALPVAASAGTADAGTYETCATTTYGVSAPLRALRDRQVEIASSPDQSLEVDLIHNVATTIAR